MHETSRRWLCALFTAAVAWFGSPAVTAHATQRPAVPPNESPRTELPTTFTASALATAIAPSDAEIRFAAPARVRFNKYGDPTEPGVVTWTQGASPFPGVTCCTNVVTPDNDSTWFRQTTGTSVSISMPSTNADDGYRIDSYDANGYYVGTAFTDAPTYSEGIYIDPASAFSYSGTWTAETVAGSVSGTVESSTQPGASATFTTDTRLFSWITTKGPSYGSAKIYIDGTLAKTVSLYASTTEPARVVFQRSWPPDPTLFGTHTLTIVVVGTAGHPRVDVDAAGGDEID